MRCVTSVSCTFIKKNLFQTLNANIFFGSEQSEYFFHGHNVSLLSNSLNPLRTLCECIIFPHFFQSGDENEAQPTEMKDIKDMNGEGRYSYVGPCIPIGLRKKGDLSLLVF